jgi:hypothetical protein
MKTCTKCNITKELSEFNKSINGKFQKRGDCKICQSKYARIRNKITYDSQVKWKWNMKSTFNLTVDDYNNLFTKQKGCCAICKKHQSEFRKRLAIDHDHETDIIRGLLCSSCNTALGLLKDDVEILESAINYLNKQRVELKKLSNSNHFG